MSFIPNALASVLMAALAFASPAAAAERTLQLGKGETLRFEVLDPGADSGAQKTAREILGHLVAGNLEAAAALSTAPERRLEVLRGYRASVGEAEFRRVFGRFFEPQNRIVAEVAIDRHRLLVWNLGEAGDHLAGQYYVEVDGRYLMEDRPGETRARLQRVLQAYRDGRIR